MIGVIIIKHIPANTGHSPNAVSMLGQRQRRWANIETALGVCLVFSISDKLPLLFKPLMSNQHNTSHSPYVELAALGHLLWRRPNIIFVIYPLPSFSFFLRGDRLYTSKSDAQKRQILTSKVGHPTERMKTFIVTVDPSNMSSNETERANQDICGDLKLKKTLHFGARFRAVIVYSLCFRLCDRRRN